MNARLILLLLITHFASASTQGAFAATFQDLARLIPDEANALVLMDVEQLLATPLAQNQGWSRKLETAYVERPVVLPPEAKKLAIGAILTREEDLRPVWEIAVMETPEAVPVRAIVRAKAAVSSDCTAFLPVSPKTASPSPISTTACSPPFAPPRGNSSPAG
jgi:hypothetical protein